MHNFYKEYRCAEIERYNCLQAEKSFYKYEVIKATKPLKK
jgi:hypothetical protein